MWWLCLLLATLWEAASPEQWSEAQLRQIFVDSPWAQITRSGSDSRYERATPVYLASARPIRLAESELRRRTKPGEDVLYDDYRRWMEENADSYIVIAVQPPQPEVLADAEEAKKIESDSKLIVRGKRHNVKVMFTPSRTDPWLRLAFPRAVREADKQFEVEIYLPGVSGNYRIAVFALKDLMWKGSPEY